MRLLGLHPLIYLLAIALVCCSVTAMVAGPHEVFDECYYHPAAVDTVHGVASNVEHPFLVKLIVGVSISLFGDWWVAWRLPIILFSLASLVLTYLIARKFLSVKLSLFAVSLVLLSTIFMLVGSCAILDMPCLAFGLAGLYVAILAKASLVKRKSFLLFGMSGLMFGLSFLCKELAVLMFLPTLIWLIIVKAGWSKILWMGGVGFCVAFFGMWLYDLVYAGSSVVDISNPVIHLWLVIQYQLKLNGVVRAESMYPWYAPWAWVSPFGENALNPLKWISYDNGWAWKAQPNVAVEYLMFPLLALLPVVYWVKRNSVALLSLLWIGFTFLPWLTVGFFVKTEANFYIVYSIPFLAIGSAYLYSLIKNKKLRYGLAIGQLIAGILCFLWYFPVPLF